MFHCCFQSTNKAFSSQHSSCWTSTRWSWSSFLLICIHHCSFCSERKRRIEGYTQSFPSSQAQHTLSFRLAHSLKRASEYFIIEAPHKGNLFSTLFSNVILLEQLVVTSDNSQLLNRTHFHGTQYMNGFTLHESLSCLLSDASSGCKLTLFFPLSPSLPLLSSLTNSFVVSLLLLLFLHHFFLQYFSKFLWHFLTFFYIHTLFVYYVPFLPLCFDLCFLLHPFTLILFFIYVFCLLFAFLAFTFHFIIIPFASFSISCPVSFCSVPVFCSFHPFPFCPFLTCYHHCFPIWSFLPFISFPLSPPVSPVAAPLPPSCCSGSATPGRCMFSCCV